MGYNDKYPDMSAMYAVQFEYENKLKDKIKELETKLESIRKALEIATHRLNQIAQHDCDQGCMYVASKRPRTNNSIGKVRIRKLGNVGK